MAPIENMGGRLPSLGRISCGYQVAKKVKRKGKEVTVTHPQRTETLCFHSDNLANLELIKTLVGGRIVQSPLDEERWTLISETKRLAVQIPPVDDIEKVAPQYMEAFTKAGIQRRCTGVKTLLHRLPPKQGEVVGSISHEECPCICNAKGLAEEDRCKPVIRLSVVIADLWQSMRGLGVWTITSAGWKSNASLAGYLELYKVMLGQVGGAIRFELVVKMANSSHGPVPELHLELDQTPQEAAALASGTMIDAHQLPAPDEGAVGTFVPPDAPGEAPDEPVEETDGAQAEDAVVVFCGVEVPYVGGKPAGDDVAGATSTQRAVLKRHADHITQKTGEAFPLEAAYSAYAGHEYEDASRESAEAFDSFLRDATRRLEGKLV